jgi:hypothetical protein
MNVFCKLLTILGFASVLFLSCEKEKNNIDSMTILLTNDSVKVWYLYKLIDKNSRNILPFPCIVDDEYKFYKKGQLTVNNMGTTFAEPDTSFSAPIFCKDTTLRIDTLSWQINSKQDSMLIKDKNVIYHAKIIKLISDSLIIKRLYSDSIEQTEYYINK